MDEGVMWGLQGTLLTDPPSKKFSVIERYKMCHGLETHVRDLMENKFEAFGGSNINNLLYPQQTKFGGYIGITLSVCPSIHVPCKCNSS